MPPVISIPIRRLNGLRPGFRGLRRWTTKSSGVSGGVCVCLLVDDDDDECVCDVQFGWTALHGGAGSGDVATCTVLLANGAELEAKTRDGWTALLWAVRRGRADVVRLLLDHGADAGATTNVSAPRSRACVSCASCG